MLTHFSLFTGWVNAFGIASKWAGFNTVGMCENNEWRYEKLTQKHKGVPVWRDVRDVSAESVRAAGIWGGVKLLTASPPCGPVSRAGKRGGKDDDRYLWAETLEVISQLRPDWFVAENPVEFASVGLDDTFDYLENEGYSTGAFIIPAVAVYASHRRDRLFMVAYSGQKRLEGLHEKGYKEYLQRLEAHIPRQQRKTTPRVLRRGHGFRDWKNRIMAIGDSFDPRQVYPILQAIAEIEGVQECHTKTTPEPSEQ